jgi:hypothetical protein
VTYDRTKFRHIRLVFWLLQLAVLVGLWYLHAPVKTLVWYSLIIAVLTGVEANLPSEEGRG